MPLTATPASLNGDMTDKGPPSDPASAPRVLLRRRLCCLFTTTGLSRGRYCSEIGVCACCLSPPVASLGRGPDRAWRLRCPCPTRPWLGESAVALGWNRLGTSPLSRLAPGLGRRQGRPQLGCPRGPLTWPRLGSPRKCVRRTCLESRRFQRGRGSAWWL